MTSDRLAVAERWHNHSTRRLNFVCGASLKSGNEKFSQAKHSHIVSVSARGRGCVYMFELIKRLGTRVDTVDKGGGDNDKFRCLSIVRRHRL